MGGISALFCSGRASSRADRAAGGHLSGRVGDDAVADRGALRPHWAQRHDCGWDAASGRRPRAGAAASRVWVVGTHDGPAWAGDAIGALLAGVLADLFGVPWAIGVISAATFL